MILALALLTAVPATANTPADDPFGPLIRKVGNWDLRRNRAGICNTSVTFGENISLALFLRPDHRIGMVIGSTRWSYEPVKTIGTVFAFEANEFSGKSEIVAEKTGRSLTAWFGSDFLGAFQRSKRMALYVGEDALDPSSDSTANLTFVDNAPVVDALLSCMDQAPGVGASLAATPPRYLNKAQVITGDDYPVAVRRAGVSGTVRYRVAVSEAGRAIGCSILSGSGNAELDAQSCTLILRRARFEPARNAVGQAVSGNLEARVFWRLPAD